MSQVATSFSDSTYSASNKPSTTTLKADIQALETAHNDTDTNAATLTGSQTLTNKILTSPVINTGVSGTAILDEDTLASDSATKLATQQSIKAYVDSGTVTMTNKTLTSPTINAGTIAKPTVNASVQGVQNYTPSAAGTATIDLSLANRNTITMPAGNITIALSNATTGQIFTIDITQDGTGSRTVTWFSTIRWAGGSAPTLTTTLNKRDSFGFICTGSNTYDGYVIGFNI